MSSSSQPQKRLPEHPSAEHLRKQAKRLAKEQSLKLAEAQRRLAADYGRRNWADLMRAVRTAGAAVTSGPQRPLSKAAARGDLEAVRRLLAEGEPATGLKAETESPLWQACNGDEPAERRLAVAQLLLDAGAEVRQAGRGKTTALHAAARRGPLALVELLIRGGALSWQADEQGRIALDEARSGIAPDRDAIIELLDRPVIRDPRFREAVRLIDAGDVAGLSRALDAHPALLRERAIEPDCYPQDYFRDPRLFWFIANNPTRQRTMPANIVEVARTMIARGVDKGDLDYALELVMTSSPAREQGHQWPLAKLLLEAGATATQRAIFMTLAHRELEPIEALLAAGQPMTAPIAAAFGRTRELEPLLANASEADRQAALGMAVINGQIDAVRLCLDAGADPNAVLPVHRHSTPLHQAVALDDVGLTRLLIERGARVDIRDTLWNSTPLGWAAYMKKPTTEAYLRGLKAL